MSFAFVPGWLAAALAAAAGAYLVLLATLFVAQRQILFRPDRTPPQLARIAEPALLARGLAAVRLSTADGLDLLAWFLPPAGNGPVVLYLHGNAGHIGHRGARLQHFAAIGWGALLVEYRGYGGNPGSPDEAGLAMDAAAGLAALTRRGFAAGRIVVWGESLGSGLATALAARHDVGAVVLETPYTSIAALARQRYPFAPVDLLLRDRFDSLVHMPAIRAPVLVAIGGRDPVVPPAMGRALHAAAAGPAELWEAAEGGHNDLLDYGLMAAAQAFVRRHLPPG
ncbi:MAG: alpha/beta hydrolase [Acetobacteraceae bacterium]|nr:alpha/beta hydrolase [Acetobacteraceae bacterium]